MVTTPKRKRHCLSGASLVPIRIGIDALLMPDLPPLTRRTVGLFLFALHHFDRFNEYVFYTPRGGLKALWSPKPLTSESIMLNYQLPRWTVVKTHVPLRPVLLRQLIHQLAFRFVAERDGLDIVHSLTPISPFAMRQASLEEAPPVIVTVWDEPKLSRWLEASLKQASRIAVASRPLTQRLRERFGVPDERVRVLPVGVDPSHGMESYQWAQAVKAWVGLYRRVFEEAVAKFCGWEDGLIL